MWPWSVTRTVENGTLTVVPYFLDIQDTLFNVFNDPELAELVGREMIKGAVQLNENLMLEDHLGWSFIQGSVVDDMYWLTRNGEMPAILPIMFTDPKEAMAVGVTLLEMACAMRLAQAKREALGLLAS